MAEADGRARSGDALTHEVANRFDLTPEQRLVPTRRGDQLQIKDRTLWAATRLCRADLPYRPRREMAVITEAGARPVEDDVLSIASRDLMAIPSYAMWKLGAPRQGPYGPPRVKRARWPSSRCARPGAK